MQFTNKRHRGENQMRFNEPLVFKVEKHPFLRVNAVIGK